VIARDDAGKPDDAIRHATELVSSEKVDLPAGTFLSNIGLAVADFALRNKTSFVWRAWCAKAIGAACSRRCRR
jgi:branched-chain amino acid transport system substrate-binding protein